MKIKIKKVEQTKNPTPTGTDPLKEVSEYQSNLHKYEYSLPQLRTFVAQTYREVFPNQPYPEERPIKLVALATAYELQVRGYRRCGLEVPAKILRNHKAFINFNTTQLDENMQFLVKLNNQEGETMKTAKVVPVKKAPKLSADAKAKENVTAKAKEKPVRPTVANTYISLFERVAKGEKLTDAQIAEQLRKAFPDKKKYTETDVRAVRSLYNNGKIAGQASKPSNPVEAYVPATTKTKTKK